jgi:iron complex outermembrane receptor protein
MTCGKLTKWRVALLAGAGLAALSSGTASAQIEEIIVTAQKREQGIQSVPISISAITGDQLEAMGVDDLSEMAFHIPNFDYKQSGQLINARIGIRGVASVGNSGFESSVGVFLDEAYVPRPGSTIGALYDVRAVEVLRGPQGTLFGRNTSMGAMSIRTNEPTSEGEGGLRTSVSDIDGTAISGYVSGPLTERMAGRFAFNIRDKDGWVTNTFEGEDELARRDDAMRARINLDVSDSFTLKLIADYQEIEYHGNLIDLLPGSVTPGFDAAFTSIFGETLDYADAFDDRIHQVHSDASKNTQFGLNLNATWDVGDHTITSITSHRDWEDDGKGEDVVRLPADILSRDRLTTTDNFSQELRISSPTGGDVEYIAGVYYYTEEYNTDTIYYLGDDLCNDLWPLLAPPLVAACNAPIEDDVVDAFHQDLKSYAVFVSGTFHVDENISLTGGLRWSRDEKDGSFERVRNNIGALPIAATATLTTSLPGGVDAAELSNEKLTWSLNASYDLNDDVMVFATASTGFKSGGINSEAQANTLPRTFDPEDTQNYEIGIKSMLLDRRLMVNATLYQTDLDDFQERTFTGLGFIVGNAGSLRVRGLELDFNAKPNDKLDLNGSLAWLDSEFTDFTGAPGLPAGPAQDLTGERRQGSPEFTYSFGGQYTDDFGSGDLEWFVRADHQYTGETLLASNLNPQSNQPGYGLTNFRLGIGSRDGNWRLTGYVANAFDTGYCTYIYNQVFGGTMGGVSGANNTSVQRCVRGMPKSAGVELSLKF